MTGTTDMFKHFKRHLGEKLLSDLQQDDLQMYVTARRNETPWRKGKFSRRILKDGRLLNGITDGSLRTELIALQSVLALAKKYGHSVPELDFVAVTPPRKNRDRTLAVDEERKLFAEMHGWLLDMATIANETGLSQGDILRLDENMLDYENGVIVPTGGRKKTSVVQAAPLTPTVAAIFARLREQRKQMKVRPIDSGLVFVRPEGGKKPGQPITQSMVEGAFDRACKRAGINNFVFHDLRHNCMTRWARENVAPAVAMRAMGWSSAQQLLAYTNLRNQDVGHAFGTAARRLSLVLPNGKRPAKKTTK